MEFLGLAIISLLTAFTLLAIVLQKDAKELIAIILSLALGIVGLCIYFNTYQEPPKSDKPTIMVKNMTVEQLINELSKLDKTLPVTTIFYYPLENAEFHEEIQGIYIDCKDSDKEFKHVVLTDNSAMNGIDKSVK